MIRKAIIISIEKDKLTNKEFNLIRFKKPWGVILFKRNIKNYIQTKKLIKKIRVAIQDKKYPILIDEEGGTVSRLTNIINQKIFSQKLFGDIYEKNANVGLKLYSNYISKICKILKDLGININTVPVLDLKHKKTHKIIGTRSYSDRINIVNNLGKFCIKNYKLNKIGTVIKHIPGHGSSNKDSHLELPIVKKKYKDLKKSDFACFKNSQSFFAMTAHIKYFDIDSAHVSTFSKKIIKNIIRKYLSYKGILISDDISMKALKYDLTTNALNSLKAGCNLALYCSGKYKESLKLLQEMPVIDKFTKKKTSEFYKFLR